MQESNKKKLYGYLRKEHQSMAFQTTASPQGVKPRPNLIPKIVLTKLSTLKYGFALSQLSR